MKFAEVVLPIPVDRTFHYRIPENLIDQVSPGMRVSVPFGKANKPGFVIAVSETASVEETKEINSVLDKIPVVSPKMFELAKWIANEYMCSYGEAVSAVMPVNLTAPKRLKNIVEEEKIPGTAPELKDSQKIVLEQISGSIKANEYKNFVLHGVTSSGKTEVYLAAIAKAIECGRSAIYLLPEISLTPQFIRIVQARFPGMVGVWHSRLSVGKKYLTWENALNGRIKIMLGARSAVFAPFENVGVIIVDEEHEPTYKQEQKPTYHIREVAAQRAKIENCAVVFGSATPSLESYYSAKTGKSVLLQMKDRIDMHALPKVRLVDLSKISAKYRILSIPLKEALTKILAKREQAVFFLNRRGFSPSVTCPSCGNVWQCPRCSVSLVFHKATNDLRCHYCNYTHKWPSICPTCSNRDLSVFGIGTQRVEEEIKKLFPQARVFRLDRDTAKNKDVYHEAYASFKDESFDILLGTQMVAKGFDFPRVTLVGVIDADTALYLPDFRAAERTFQLITQVAGRAGRSALGGEVIVQTVYPGHYAILAAKDHDYEKFYNIEIDSRKQANYPPFSRLVNILVRAAKEEKAMENIEKIAHDLKIYKLQNNYKFEILGPIQAAHSKIRRMFRWQLMLKGNSDEVLNAARTMRNYFLPRGILLTVDVDPQSVL